MCRVTTDQVIGLALERRGDGLQDWPGVRTPATLDLVKLAAIDPDGLGQLCLGQATMLAPFTKVMLRRRILVIHGLIIQMSV